MTPIKLFQWAGALAILGGGLRIVSAFVPWEPNNLALEMWYGVIDLALLAGLIGIYVFQAEDLGRLGLSGFAIAFAGQALIVGPDVIHPHIDMYEAGIAVIALGLVVLSIQILRTKTYPKWIALFWLAAPVLSIGGSGLGHPDIGFVLAGLSYGAAFMGAGSVLRARAT